MDIETNILRLVTGRKELVARAANINPLLAQQLFDAIQVVSEFTIDTFHRGRMGVPKFKKEPQKARVAISRVEDLLAVATSLSETYAEQEEIPVLDL